MTQQIHIQAAERRIDLQRAREYESRLFDGGAYAGAYLQRHGDRTPKAQMIKRARLNYNDLRVKHGLLPIEPDDWHRAPVIRLSTILEEHP